MELSDAATDTELVLPLGFLQQPNKSEPAKPTQLKFELIVKFFTKFAEAKGKEKSKLAKIFTGLLFKENRQQSFTYNILRLLFPSEDRDRGNYGIKQKTLASIMKGALGLSKEDYERMKHFKNPSFNVSGVGVGDFPSIVYTIAVKYCKKQSTITVEQVNKLLDQLVKKSDLAEQTTLFTQFLKVCTAEQIKWLVRIILKDLKLGLKFDAVMGEFHKDAHDYFNLTNSLKEVCRKFEDKNASLENELMLFHPIKPMLAGKKPLEYFDTQQKQYYLQTKFDGQRLQVHIKGQDIKMFSRNGKDYSHVYKQLVPLFRSNINADACIIDGQVLVLQKDTLNMVPFGMNKMVALGNDTSKMQICYKVFDALWVRIDTEEANLMGYTLRKRKNIMDKFIKEEKGKLEIVKGELLHGTDAITKKFYQSIQRNQEGVILKDPNSLYLPNDRSTNWIKLKGDYIDGLTDTLDLIIIGGYYGTSSYRTGTDWTERITSFLLGVIAHVDTKNPQRCHIIPFCKVGTGYSEQTLADLRLKLRKSWIKSKPSYMIGNWKPKVDDKPDCFIDSPANSIILEIKAAEFIKTEAFGLEKTLRFPRVVKVRFDKDWSEAIKVEEVRVMMGEGYTKGMKRRQAEGEDGSGPEDEVAVIAAQGSAKTKKRAKKKEGKQGMKTKKTKEVLEWFKGIDFDEKDIISNIFAGQEFMVLNLKVEEYKPVLQRKILQNCGTVVQNPVSSTKFIICQKFDFRFRTLATSSMRQLLFIKPIYVDCCIASCRMLPLSPIFLTTIPRQKADYFNTRFDLYGDSYTEFSNLQQLDIILQEMEVFDDSVDKKLQLKIMGKEMTKVAYYQNLPIEKRVGLRMRGYRLVQQLTDDVTHIILRKDVLTAMAHINQFIKGCTVKPIIQYIEDLEKDIKFEL